MICTNLPLRNGRERITYGVGFAPISGKRRTITASMSIFLNGGRANIVLYKLVWRAWSGINKTEGHVCVHFAESNF